MSYSTDDEKVEDKLGKDLLDFSDVVKHKIDGFDTIAAFSGMGKSTLVASFPGVFFDCDNSYVKHLTRAQRLTLLISLGEVATELGLITLTEREIAEMMDRKVLYVYPSFVNPIRYIDRSREYRRKMDNQGPGWLADWESATINGYDRKLKTDQFLDVEFFNKFRTDTTFDIFTGKLIIAMSGSGKSFAVEQFDQRSESSDGMKLVDGDSLVSWPTIPRFWEVLTLEQQVKLGFGHLMTIISKTNGTDDIVLFNPNRHSLLLAVKSGIIPLANVAVWFVDRSDHDRNIRARIASGNTSQPRPTGKEMTENRNDFMSTMNSMGLDMFNSLDETIDHLKRAY